MRDQLIDWLIDWLRDCCEGGGKGGDEVGEKVELLILHQPNLGKNERLHHENHLWLSLAISSNP